MDNKSYLWSLITNSPPDLVPANEAEWEQVVHEAARQGVAPLCYRALQATGVDLPPGAERALERAYYASAGRTQVLKAELERLQAAFTQVGVPCLPLKGAALAWRVYPQAALRPMADLDLLVQPGDLLGAIQAARGLDYRLDKLTYHAVLRGGPGRAIALELHWCLPGGKSLPPLAQFAQAAIIDHFTYLYCAAHLLRQHPDDLRLLWRYDLRLLRQRLVDAEQLSALAEQLDLADILPAGKALLSASNTGESLELAPRLDIRQETRQALKFLPLRARLTLTLVLLFPSREYMLWRYKPKPGWLWPAYYGRRLVEWTLQRP